MPEKEKEVKEEVRKEDLIDVGDADEKETEVDLDKKTEGEKKKKPAKDKPKTLKMVLMFGIAGVLAYVSYYCGSSALAEHKKPNTDIVQLIMRSLFAFLAICWALVCVKYPFRKEKKGRKKQ